MKEYHLFYAPDVERTGELPEEEARHALRVLRMKEGDALLATDGRGTFFACRITLAHRDRCVLRIEGSRAAERLWKGEIHLAVAPTKHADRMEWLAEKATEVGLDGLHFVVCKNSERRVVKTDRVERIVTAAMKQSHKGWRPAVTGPTDFRSFIAQPFEGERFIAHCFNMPSPGEMLEDEPDRNLDTDALPPSPFLLDVTGSAAPSLVLIGPEGDFTPEEVRLALEAGFRPISLGDSRLRTETAALAAVHLLAVAKRFR